MTDVYAMRRDFLNALPNIERTRVSRTLAKRVKSGQSIWMRAELIEKLHAFGWRVKGERFTNGTDFHDAETITKTGMQYAAFLDTL